MPLFRRRKAEPPPSSATATGWPPHPEVVAVGQPNEPPASPPADAETAPTVDVIEVVEVVAVVEVVSPAAPPARESEPEAQPAAAGPSAAPFFASPGRWHLASADTRVPVRTATSRAAPPREQTQGRWHQV